MDVLGGWVAPGGTNQWQRGVWRGVRYTSGNGSGTSGLHVDSLDAAMAMPIVAGAGLVGDSTPMGEGAPGGQGGTITGPEMVDGMAMSLHQNLMPISGFAQWYPFGTGKYYQRQDEQSLFRFVVREQSDGGRT
eukprot:gene31234-17669_t